MAYDEARKALSGKETAQFYKGALERSHEFRDAYGKRRGVVKAEEMPWEDSPQGKLKHVIDEALDTRECALDIYQQVIPPGSCTGRHRHMSEEVFFVLEGRGYDLHWDVDYDCEEEYSWGWKKESQKFEWEGGDFVCIPPYSMHQHFNVDEVDRARIITATSRIIRALGFDWLDQVESSPDYVDSGG